MDAPQQLFSARGVSIGGRLTGCLLWQYVDANGPRLLRSSVIVSKSTIRMIRHISRQTLDRHLRELRYRGWIDIAEVPNIDGRMLFGLFFVPKSRGLS